jgi:hypothetical protein
MKKTTTVSPSNAVRRLLSLNLFGDGLRDARDPRGDF